MKLESEYDRIMREETKKGNVKVYTPEESLKIIKELGEEMNKFEPNYCPDCGRIYYNCLCSHDDLEDE